MSKYRETAADHVWKEKCCHGVTSREAVALALVVAVTALLSFFAL